MNNEPVAFVIGCGKYAPVMANTVLKVGTPLYTHPAKTLTDEEILEIGRDCARNPDINFQITFARAILKKASEK